VVVEYFNHSTTVTPVASFEFALELFREAMELSKIQCQWNVESSWSDITLPVSEEDLSLDFTIQQFADIWKLLCVGRPFRASSTKVVVNHHKMERFAETSSMGFRAIYLWIH